MLEPVSALVSYAAQASPSMRLLEYYNRILCIGKRLAFRDKCYFFLATERLRLFTIE